jgi:hypothetical protein
MTAHSVRIIIPGTGIGPLNSCKLCASYDTAYIYLWCRLWSITFLLNLFWCRHWGFDCFWGSVRRIQPGILLQECTGIPALIVPDSPRIPPRIRQKKPILPTKSMLALQVFRGVDAKILPESHMQDSCTTTLLRSMSTHWSGQDKGGRRADTRAGARLTTKRVHTSTIQVITQVRCSDWFKIVRSDVTVWLQL